MQDASHILAEQAAQLIDAPTHSNQTPTSVAALARRLGISERHLLRIFEARFGVTPLRYLQTRRLLTAKQLLTDTTLSLAQIAQISGFGSLRRLNTVFSSQYQLPLGQLRKPGSAAGAATAKNWHDPATGVSPAI
jgi:AraC family transcriptional regulator of adaptative response / DNA-3-methyladenine glycosylase II